MSEVFLWLTCPVLGLALVLALVTLVALFRAPRTEATHILEVFATALTHLGSRLPRPSRLRLDRRSRAPQSQQCAKAEHEEG